MVLKSSHLMFCDKCTGILAARTDTFRAKSWSLIYQKDGEKRTIATEADALCYINLQHQGVGISKLLNMEPMGEGVDLLAGVCDYWENTSTGESLWIERRDK